MYRTLSEATVFDTFKKQLFGKEYDIPILTEQEMFLCYLMSTNRFERWVMENILKISQDRFVELLFSLERKMTTYGYKLPEDYHKARRRLKDLPEKRYKNQS